MANRRRGKVAKGPALQAVVNGLTTKATSGEARLEPAPVVFDSPQVAQNAKIDDPSAKVSKTKITKAERREKARLKIEANRIAASHRGDMEHGTNYQGGKHQGRKNNQDPNTSLTGANAMPFAPQQEHAPEPVMSNLQQWYPQPQTNVWGQIMSMPNGGQQMPTPNLSQTPYGQTVNHMSNTPYGQGMAIPPGSRPVPTSDMRGGIPFPSSIPAFNGMPSPMSTQMRDFSTAPPDQRGRDYARGRENSPRREVMPRPEPTADYLKVADMAAKGLDKPRPMLLIFDLNGTLVYRPNRDVTRAKLRPNLGKFLDFVFGNFQVMVWSSSKPENVEAMCAKAFTAQQHGQLVQKWSRKNLRLSQQHYNAKVQVYKHLTWVWDFKSSKIYHPEHSLGRRWDATNTILVDDSALKSASEPFNLIEIPEWDGKANAHDETLLLQLMDYLDEIKYYDNVASCIKEHPFKWDSNWK